MNNINKTRTILRELLDGKVVTDMSACETVKTYRLSGIIYNLRQEGFNIQDRWIESENRYKEYYLVDNDYSTEYRKFLNY